MKKKQKQEGIRQSLTIPIERWKIIEHAIQLDKVGHYKKNDWYVGIIFNYARDIVEADRREADRRRNH